MVNELTAEAIVETSDGARDVITEVRREEALLKTGALQNAIFNSANFSSIATDEKGVIQIFNVGAERMLGYLAGDVVNKITPADISDPRRDSGLVQGRLSSRTTISLARGIPARVEFVPQAEVAGVHVCRSWS
jgi:PAS domain-containing protein